MQPKFEDPRAGGKNPPIAGHETMQLLEKPQLTDDEVADLIATEQAFLLGHVTINEETLAGLKREDRPVYVRMSDGEWNKALVIGVGQAEDDSYTLKVEGTTDEGTFEKNINQKTDGPELIFV